MRLWPRPSSYSPAPSASASVVGRSGALAPEDSDATEVAGGRTEGGAARLTAAHGGPARGAGVAAACAQQDRSAAMLALLAARASETGGAARRMTGDGDLDAASDASGFVGRGEPDPPGSLGARLADLGRQLLHNIDREYEDREQAAGEKLGACYVAAAAAAAAAASASVSRGGSFVGCSSLAGGKGFNTGSLTGAHGAGASGVVGAAVAAARRQLAGGGGAGGVSRRIKAAGAKSRRASGMGV
jgi:hypothetical protein